MFGGLLSTGAYLLRRKLIGGDLERSNNLQQQQKQQKLTVTRLERRALRSLRLVEKVESIGLENIIKTQPSAMSQMANGIVNRSASPMAQLTSLKNMQHNQQFRNMKNASNSSIDNICFDRDQILQVIEKGVSSIEAEKKANTIRNVKEDEMFLPGIGLKNLQKKTGLIGNRDTNSSSGSDEDIRVLNSKRKSNNVENSSLALSTLAENAHVNQMKRQRSRRHLKNGQRQDLGTIESRVRTDLGRVSISSTIPTKIADTNKMMTTSTNELQQFGADNPLGQQPQQSEQPTLTQSFVGTVSSLLFGRKGGWL